MSQLSCEDLEEIYEHWLNIRTPFEGDGINIILLSPERGGFLFQSTQQMIKK